MKKIILLLAALLAYAGFAFAAVNINTATKEQLESLNGIGPVKAQAIIDYRKKNGNFKKLEDVKNVDGIGEATFEKIKGDISLSGASTMAAPEKKAEEKKVAAPEKKAEEKKAAAPEKKTEEKKAAAPEKKAEEKKAAAPEKKAEEKKADKKADEKKADKKTDEKKADEKKKDEEKKKEEEKKK